MFHFTVTKTKKKTFQINLFLKDALQVIKAKFMSRQKIRAIPGKTASRRKSFFQEN